jgi:hypothetical protein
MDCERLCLFGVKCLLTLAVHFILKGLDAITGRITIR